MLVATILGRTLRDINAITGANRSQEPIDHRNYLIIGKPRRDISRRGGCAPCVRAVPAHAG